MCFKYLENEWEILRESIRKDENREGYLAFIVGIIMFFVTIIYAIFKELEIITLDNDFLWISATLFSFLSAIIFSSIKHSQQNIRISNNTRKYIEEKLNVIFQILDEKNDLFGINEFNTSRRKMENLEEILKRAEKSIDIYAIKHSKVVEGPIRRLLEEKAKNGCKIRLLMMEAFDKNGRMSYNVQELENRREYSTPRIFNRIKDNANTLIRWRDRLNDSIKSRIQIQAYNETPTCTMVLLDGEYISGFVQLEVFLPCVDVINQPHYQTSFLLSEKFFNQHVKIFNSLWKSSHDLDRDRYLQED